MADGRDEQVASAYRALDAREPPPALDARILAAAREAAKVVPPRPRTQRWAVPLSLAAVVVLSVTVTLRVQHEAPELEAPVVAQAPAAARDEADAPLRLKPEEQLRAAASAPARERRAEARPEPKPFADAAPKAKATVPAASPPPAAPAAAQPAPLGRLEDYATRTDLGRNLESSVAGAGAREAEDRIARDAEAAARAPRLGPTQALAKRSQEAAANATSAAPLPPEKELERIAALRAEGRQDEADKALAEFRRRNPDYRIPEEMLKRVERR